MGALSQWLRTAPKLNNDEKIILINKARAGDKDALWKVMHAHIGLLVKVVRTYSYRNRKDIEDFVHYCFPGVIKAIETYDQNKGAFTTHCYRWAKQSLLRNIKSNEYLIRYSEDYLSKNTFRYSFVYLSKIIGEDSEYGNLLGEVPPDIIDKEALKRLLNTLTEKEKYIIIERYGLNGGEPKKLRAVGKELNTSRETIRQKEKIALNKMRRVLYFSRWDMPDIIKP